MVLLTIYELTNSPPHSYQLSNRRLKFQMLCYIAPFTLCTGLVVFRPTVDLSRGMPQIPVY